METAPRVGSGPRSPLPPIPAAKQVPGTSFLVDGFKYARPGIDAYFLTHAHADHTTGLTKDWSLGPIYCTEITARHITAVIGVNPARVTILPPEDSVQVCGVSVASTDANHCPGAVQLLFKLPDGRRVVHSGDVRFHSAFESSELLQSFRGADRLYLDTTYCHPRHAFASRESCVRYVAEQVRLELERGAGEEGADDDELDCAGMDDGVENEARDEDAGQPEKSGTTAVISDETDLSVVDEPPFTSASFAALVIIATYSLGKERILAAVHRSTGLKIYAKPSRIALYETLKLPDFDPGAILTSDASSTPIHSVDWGSVCDTHPWVKPNWPAMERRRAAAGAARAVAFIPSGWVHAAKGRAVLDQGFERATSASKAAPEAVVARVQRLQACSMHLVPYSEHSSFSELLEYVSFLRPGQVVPTVGDRDPAAVRRMTRYFRSLVDKTSAKARFLAEFANREGVGTEGEGEKEEVEGEKHPVAAPASTSVVAPAEETRASPATSPCAAFSARQSVRAILDASFLPNATLDRLLAQHGNDPERVVDAVLNGPGRLQSPPKRPRRARQGGAQALSAAKPGSKTAAPTDRTQRSIVSFLSPSASGRAQVEENSSGAGVRAWAEASEGGGVGDAPASSRDAMDVEPSAPCPRTPSASASDGTPLPLSPRTSEAPTESMAETIRLLEFPPDSFDPGQHACWRAGEPTPYWHVACALEACDSSSRRLRIGDLLCNCFSAVLALCPEDIRDVTSLILGRLIGGVGSPCTASFSPDLGVGHSSVFQAVLAATGASPAQLRRLCRDLGDMGDAAAQTRSLQTRLAAPSPLSARQVVAGLREVASSRGAGSAARKQAAMLRLLRAARGPEPRFLVRTFLGALRVGAGWRTVVPGLARAVARRERLRRGEEAAAALPDLDRVAASAVQAYERCPDAGVVLAAILRWPGEVLGEDRLGVAPGVPCMPMLARAAGGIEDALQLAAGVRGGGEMTRAGEGERAPPAEPVLAELKYDGMRAQIHCLADGGARVFSRSCEDKTAAFPEVGRLVFEAAGFAGGGEGEREIRSLQLVLPAILDGEIVAYEWEETRQRDAGSPPCVRLLAFQDLASGPRQGGSSKASSVVEERKVCVFVFDLLLVGGRSLLREPLWRRRRLLAELLPGCRPGGVQLSRTFAMPGFACGEPEAGAGEAEAGEAGQAKVEEHGRAGDAESLDALDLATRLRQAVLQAHEEKGEGLMLKSMWGPYAPAKRSESWIKLKRDYCEDLHDSLDLVVVGAWHGNGRKAGWMSPFLLAVYDSETETLQSLCRCMSGFTDQFYRQATERLKATIIPAKKPYVETDEQPPMWFEPTEVWEVRGADLSISPVHKAAAGRIHAERGLGLRFPRFLRIRPDKTVEEASTADILADLYNRQTRRSGAQK